MTTYTEPPWYKDIDEDLIIIRDSNGVSICAMTRVPAARTAEEQDANAALMYLAPELFRTVVDLVDVMRCSDIDTSSETLDENDWQRALDDAQALIDLLGDEGVQIDSWVVDESHPANRVSFNDCTPDILTCSGKYFNFMNPENSEFGIGEIAQALSNICRFTGHTSSFYSVAQHCVIASYIVPECDAMAALLHDAAEAFMGDVSRPLKQMLPDYKAIEKRVEAAVLSRFGIREIPESVKIADRIMLRTEQRDLMPAHDAQWAITAGIDPLPNVIVPVPPVEAAFAFIQRFIELGGVV